MSNYIINIYIYLKYIYIFFLSFPWLQSADPSSREAWQQSLTLNIQYKILLSITHYKSMKRQLQYARIQLHTIWAITHSRMCKEWPFTSQRFIGKPTMKPADTWTRTRPRVHVSAVIWAETTTKITSFSWEVLCSTPSLFSVLHSEYIYTSSKRPSQMSWISERTSSLGPWSGANGLSCWL